MRIEDNAAPAETFIASSMRERRTDASEPRASPRAVVSPDFTVSEMKYTGVKLFVGVLSDID